MNAWPAATAVLDEAIRDRVFPGAVVEVGTSSGPLGVLVRGNLTYHQDGDPAQTGTVYDLASLTKVLATATLAAGLSGRGRIGLDDPISEWCPEWTGAERAAVTVRLLLEHASGLPGHRRYFEQLQGREAFARAIATEPLEYEPGTRSVYSDPGFVLLGIILERAGGKPLDAQFDSWRAASLRHDRPLRYLPPPSWAPHTAPTELDTWRGRLLRGEVHDENAAALGGIAGHAGLFGTAAAVGDCARWWMAEARRDPVVRSFTERGRVPGSSRALGWDTALPTSSCGTRMSPSAIGHTGFTGTSLWIDAENDRYVVFLSNRVHPTRAGEGISRVRRALHDALAGDLMRG